MTNYSIGRQTNESNFSRGDLSRMNIDRNKKVLNWVVVALVLYLLYKIMGG